MDGVIVDSEVHWKTTEGFFLQSLIPAWNINDQDKIIGLAVHDVYKMLVETYQLQKTKTQFIELYQEMANEIYGQKVSLIEGFALPRSPKNITYVPLARISSSPKTWIDIVLQ